MDFLTKDDFESGKYLVALNVPFAISSNAAALTFDAYSKLCGVGGIGSENLARWPSIIRSTWTLFPRALMPMYRWQVLFNRLNPFRKSRQLPGIGATIMQSMMVGSSLVRDQALKDNLADLYLNIHVRGVGMLQFDKLEQASKIGYEESVGPLREWLELLENTGYAQKPD